MQTPVLRIQITSYETCCCTVCATLGCNCHTNTVHKIRLQPGRNPNRHEGSAKGNIHGVLPAVTHLSRFLHRCATSVRKYYFCNRNVKVWNDLSSDSDFTSIGTFSSTLVPLKPAKVSDRKRIWCTSKLSGSHWWQSF